MLIKWDDTSLSQTIILSAFGLIGAIVASYIGGAVYEDVRIQNNSAVNAAVDSDMEKEV